MKPINILLIVLVVAALFATTKLSFITDLITSSPLLNQIDAENLSNRELKPYALPNTRCKAYFPGEPRIGMIGQDLFTGGLHSSVERIMADKDMTYHLGEFHLPEMPLNSTIASGPLPTAFDFKGTSPGLVAPMNQGGNNTAYGNSNFNSEPLKIQEALNRFTKEWTTIRKANVQNNIAIALKGGLYSGRELAGSLPDGRHFKLRFYCNYPHRRIVVIGAIGTETRVSSRNTAMFIDSVDIW